MKKVSLLPLIAALALLTGCPSDNRAGANNSANASGGNKSAQDVNTNINVNVNANVDPTLNATRAKEDKSVVLVVFNDATSGAPKVIATPDKIKLLKANGERIRFHVFNDLDVALTSVKMAFTTTDPLEGGELEIRDIPAGSDKVGRTSRIKAAAADGPYKYSVTATVGVGSSPPVLDPEIIINRDR